MPRIIPEGNTNMRWRTVYMFRRERTYVRRIQNQERRDLERGIFPALKPSSADDDDGEQPHSSSTFLIIQYRQSSENA
jgi:hypothetical protein